MRLSPHETEVEWQLHERAHFATAGFTGTEAIARERCANGVAEQWVARLDESDVARFSAAECIDDKLHDDATAPSAQAECRRKDWRLGTADQSRGAVDDSLIYDTARTTESDRAAQVVARGHTRSEVFGCGSRHHDFRHMVVRDLGIDELDRGKVGRLRSTKVSATRGLLLLRELGAMRQRNEDRWLHRWLDVLRAAGLHSDRDCTCDYRGVNERAGERSSDPSTARRVGFEQGGEHDLLSMVGRDHDCTARIPPLSNPFVTRTLAIAQLSMTSP